MSTSSDFQNQRQRMLHTQLMQRGISSQAVLDAMGRVPRERFVPANSKAQAYSDRALEIDCEQTISQPYMVALMTEALDVKRTHHVLEIGTGSGYQTAVLAELAGDVVSVERHEALSRQAGQVLAESGYRNITLAVSDGTWGWPALAPYDRIMVTAAAGKVPPALVDQLAEGGILVIPVGDPEGQMLEVLRKTERGILSEHVASCRFVPLVGACSMQ